MNGFEFASGSVQGRDHRIAGRNNQDAVLLRHSDHATIGIVADGCGSSKHSEVGAHLTSLFLASAMERQIMDYVLENKNTSSTTHTPTTFWDGVRGDVVALLANLILDCPKPSASTVIEYLLCTTICVVVTERRTYFAFIGDGVLIVNGEHFPLGPFPHNQPPYMSYLLTRSSLTPEDLSFRVVTFPTDDVHHFLIGTDGMLDLMRSSDRKIPSPNKTETVGPISQFWTEDRYFKNGDALRRRLTLINRDVIHPDWEQRTLNTEYGLLPDDTTMIVGRRKEGVAP